MEKKTEIKVLAATETNSVNTGKLVLGTVLLVGILNVLLIVTRGMSGI